MKIDVFSYRDYKAYLKAFLTALPNEGHGFRSRMAKVMGCKLPYLSQVLHQTAQLSPEQAEALNELLEHPPAECDYFLLLVQLGRSGTHKLSQRITSQIEASLEKRALLKNRIEIKETLSAADQLEYYSNWNYSAIHILVTIPEFQTSTAIAKRLRLDPIRVEQVLKFLRQSGLVVQEQGKFTASQKRLFISSDSPLIAKHHANWRMRVLDELDFRNQRDLHLTSVLSLSRADAPKVREVLLKAFERVRDIAKPSKEEELICVCMDFHQI